MQSLLLTEIGIFIGLNLLIIFSGKSWLYKAVSITYAKGHASSYIHDYIHFPSNKIEEGEHQEWLISSKYNKAKLPSFIKELNDSLQTTAFIVIQNDSILFEEYWYGYSSDSLSNSFSMAKSWVATLIGIAIKEGKIKDVNQKVCDFIPQFCGQKDLTIEHLLTMSSGLNWEESYYNPIGQTAEAYYGTNLKQLVTNLKVVEEPGVVFKYHSSCTQLLSYVLEAATKKTISEYISEKLWQPIGAKHTALWNTDTKNGDEKAFCCINSNARDFARLGKLYLDYGSWGGVQLVDTSFIVKASSAADLINEQGLKNSNYGYQFWIAERQGLNLFYARGLWGQYVICVPELDIIVIRLGRKYGTRLKDGHYHDFYKFVDGVLEMYHLLPEKNNL